MWQRNTRNVHRVRRIEGHCNNIHKGVNMESPVISQSVSRIFIEEVPKALP